ncbi:MAG: hypothetical protein U0441_32770 [Polyangiaceae bacterium]
MKLRWHPAAIYDLRSLPTWRLAAEVDAAVLRFAATGEGQLRRTSADDPHNVRLITARTVVLLHVDEVDEVIHVGRVFRSGR